MSVLRHPRVPPASKKIDDDWWFDAVRRPLGAYYRIDTRSLSDMHAALNEVGIIYASAGCHAGWDDGLQQPLMAKRPTSFKNVWEIPVKGGQADHPGHAFAIVGYNERGFLIQNSWGPRWGSHGYGVLTYDDWLRNAMDCWVAQLGVVTHEHRAIAGAMRSIAGEPELEVTFSPEPPSLKGKKARLRSKKPPGGFLTADSLIEWLAPRVKMAAYRIDPLKIDFTRGSLLMTSRAPAITSALAPPPTSRKLAG